MGQSVPTSGGDERGSVGDTRVGGQVLDEHTFSLLPLPRGLVDEVAEAGVARVRGALPEPVRRALLAESAGDPERFLALPPRVNRIPQSAEQLARRIGDPAHPCLNRLAGVLPTALAGGADDPDMARFTPTEGRYMRYVGPKSGLGAHRDGMCYSLIVSVFSLAGSAMFTVVDDAATRARRFLVEAGDLVLLRAPGLRGRADGRPRHAVGPPLDGERVSLTVRMSGSATQRR